jgi:acyl-CoA dehydrogenase
MSELIALCTLLAGSLALAVMRAQLWGWALSLAILTLAMQTGVLAGRITAPSFGPLSILGWSVALMLFMLSIPRVRRAVIVVPLYRTLRRTLPRLSGIVREALDSGTLSFDAEFFGGKPDWQKLRSLGAATLTQEEIDFLGGPTEVLCGMIDDWQIRHDRKEIPEAIWNYAKAQGFLGLRISKDYGGRGVSPQALSLILGKIASRSPDVFGVLMTPNALGLGELIESHGTLAQKRHYLPRLATGEDIPCLALTGPASGSDAVAFRDIGVVVRRSCGPADSIGIRASWDKRFTTLAPNATLIGVVFHLFDPEDLLGRGEDVGVTLAVVPANYPGVEIGRLHLPSGGAFPIGPTRGKDVLIPLDHVVGGEAMVGRGWEMLLDCLATSRAIALPSCAAAGAKVSLRVSTAYGRVRRQFRVPIARMQALEEPLARMIENAYVSEAARAVTAAMVNRGEKPSVISALVKYQLTERLRDSVNDAMDLHAGRAVFDGPANYLQSMYQIVPAAIAIEGANIITRTHIAFALGALRSHPYLRREIEACREADEGRGLATFEKAFLDHISFSLSNLAGAFLHNVTGGRFAGVPDKASGSNEWYRQLGRASRNFALVADLALMILGHRIRTAQKLAGRLADALSELFLLACVLKRYEDDGELRGDLPFIAFVAQNGLYRFQEAMRGTIDNFPIAWTRILMRLAVFPLGLPYRPASDRLGHTIVRLASEPGEARDRLTRHIYISGDPSDPTGLLEMAFAKAVEAEEIENTVERSVKRGELRRYLGTDWIGDAVTKAIITEREARLLRELEALRERVITVDDFDPDEVRPNYMIAGNNIKSACRAD